MFLNRSNTLVMTVFTTSIIEDSVTPILSTDVANIFVIPFDADEKSKLLNVFHRIDAIFLTLSIKNLIPDSNPFDKPSIAYTPISSIFLDGE